MAMTDFQTALTLVSGKSRLHVRFKSGSDNVIRVVAGQEGYEGGCNLTDEQAEQVITQLQKLLVRKREPTPALQILAWTDSDEEQAGLGEEMGRLEMALENPGASVVQVFDGGDEYIVLYLGSGSKGEILAALREEIRRESV